MNYKVAFKLFIPAILFISFSVNSFSQSPPSHSTPTSSESEALKLLSTIKELHQSSYWQNIKPKDFLNNLKENIIHPLDIYEGSFTNFCGYAALSYLPLHDDPKSYIKFMLELYHDGTANYGRVHFTPTPIILKTAGTLRFKGKLDIRPADQMFFLSLADHFKGYINFFNKKYKTGAENTFWASVNYGKFNRMIKELFNYNVSAKGSDLLHPHIPHLVQYIQDQLKTGTTVLYINNQFLLKKNDNLKPGIPTHYIILLGLNTESNGSLTMTYWDYGFRSLRQLSPSFLKKILFGISHCTLKQSSIE